jgi:hypothetical protein
MRCGYWWTSTRSCRRWQNEVGFGPNSWSIWSQSHLYIITITIYHLSITLTWPTTTQPTLYTAMQQGPSCGKSHNADVASKSQDRHQRRLNLNGLWDAAGLSSDAQSRDAFPSSWWPEMAGFAWFCGKKTLRTEEHIPKNAKLGLSVSGRKKNNMHTVDCPQHLRERNSHCKPHKPPPSTGEFR